MAWRIVSGFSPALEKIIDPRNTDAIFLGNFFVGKTSITSVHYTLSQIQRIRFRHRFVLETEKN